MCAAPTLLVGTPAHAAVVLPADTIIDPVEWENFLGSHPELTAGTGVSTAVAACEVAVTCPAGLALGTFALSYGVTTKVLHWAFGGSGDDRSAAYIDPDAPPGWSWGTADTTVPGPSVQAFSFRVQNNSGANAFVGADAQCYRPSTSTTLTMTTGWNSVGINNASTWVVPSNGICGFPGRFGYNSPNTWASEDELLTWTIKDASSGQPLLVWFYDPGAGSVWTITPHMECEDGDGSITTVDGDPVEISPTADGAFDLDMPSCPTATTPVVGYGTGGRSTDPGTQVKFAVPATVEGTDTGTDPDPSLSPTPTGTAAPTHSSTTTTDNNTDPHTGTFGTPSPNDDGCPPGFWSMLNPLNIFHTLQCAFVPQHLGEQLSQLSDTFQARPPGAWIVGFGAVLASVPGGFVDGSCFPLPDFTPTSVGVTAHAAQIPCESPGGDTYTAFYSLLSAGMVVTFCLRWWSMAGGMFGARED